MLGKNGLTCPSDTAMIYGVKIVTHNKRGHNKGRRRTTLENVGMFVATQKWENYHKAISTCTGEKINKILDPEGNECCIKSLETF